MDGYQIDLIIKLGGSAITEKDILETIKQSELNWCAELVKNCIKLGKNVIIVHGAGSFGHHQAREYKVSSGFSHLKEEKYKNTVKHGFSLTRQSVLKLNAAVVDSLIKKDVPATAISAFPTWLTDNKILREDGCKRIKQVIKNGYYPVLHGDGVLDQSLGCTILSGDTIIQELCEKLKVNKVVFITDVEGIYDRPPKLTGAKLVRNIKVNSQGHMSCDVQTSNSINDVTGGIRLKLQTAVNIVKMSPNTRVFISKIGSKSTQNICLNDADSESEFCGTEVIFQDV